MTDCKRNALSVQPNQRTLPRQVCSAGAVKAPRTSSGCQGPPGQDSPLDEPLPDAEAHALQLGGAAPVLLQDTRARPQRQPRPLPAGPGAAPAPLTPSPCSAARYSPATISLCSSRNSASSAIAGAAAPSGRARTPAGNPGRGPAVPAGPGKLWESGSQVKAL